MLESFINKSFLINRKPMADKRSVSGSISNREVPEFAIPCLPLAFNQPTAMRIVGEISHHDCKITLYSWNNRYLIKLETGFLEQTYKVNQFDIASEDELYKIVDTPFINEALDRFTEMNNSLRSAMERV